MPKFDLQVGVLADIARVGQNHIHSRVGQNHTHAPYEKYILSGGGFGRGVLEVGGSSGVFTPKNPKSKEEHSK
jgi:hypothetical protein